MIDLPAPRHDRFLVGGLLLVVIGLIVFITIQFLTEPAKPYSPLRYSLPQEIVGTRILHPGEEFSVYRQKCNDSNEALAIVGHSDWRQVDANGNWILGIPYRSSVLPLVIEAHECNERAGLNKIPDDMPLGTWVLEGLDCVTPGLTICQHWYTESFEVVAR